jgi:hypothetical protein
VYGVSTAPSKISRIRSSAGSPTRSSELEGGERQAAVLLGEREQATALGELADRLPRAATHDLADLLRGVHGAEVLVPDDVRGREQGGAAP